MTDVAERAPDDVAGGGRRTQGWRNELGCGDPTRPRARATSARGPAGWAPAASKRAAMRRRSDDAAPCRSISRKRWVMRAPEYTETVASTRRASLAASASSEQRVARERHQAGDQLHRRVAGEDAHEVHRGLGRAGSRRARRNGAPRRSGAVIPSLVAWEPEHPSRICGVLEGRRPSVRAGGLRCPSASCGGGEPARRATVAGGSRGSTSAGEKVIGTSRRSPRAGVEMPATVTGRRARWRGLWSCSCASSPRTSGPCASCRQRAARRRARHRRAGRRMISASRACSRGIGDRHHGLDPPVEVAPHEIR